VCWFTRLAENFARPADIMRDDFTGDTGPSDAVADLANGADLLVSEVTNSVEDFKAEQIKAGLAADDA
jgi:hypothetical protein